MASDVFNSSYSRSRTEVWQTRDSAVRDPKTDVRGSLDGRIGII